MQLIILSTIMKNFRPALIFLIAIFPLIVKGQSHEHEDHDHDHHHAKNEIGLDNSIVYFAEENEIAYGFHFHYTHMIGESKFGYGVGYERIFDEHKHNTIGVLAAYRPIAPLYFSISPGITFEDSLEEYHYSTHLEAAYDFEVGKVHLGPIIAMAHRTGHTHFSMGLHIGFGF